MSFWITVYRLGLAAIGVLVAVAAVLFFTPKWREYQALQRELEHKRAEVAVENDRLNELKARLERFESDPEFVVQLGHEQGLARPGEVLFKIPSEDGGRQP